MPLEQLTDPESVIPEGFSDSRMLLLECCCFQNALWNGIQVDSLFALDQQPGTREARPASHIQPISVHQPEPLLFTLDRS